MLATAHGESTFVVAVVLDVRGFTSFAKLAESAEAAMYLKSAYTRILDRYFDDACFFKPTGDGLVILLEYTEPRLRAVVSRAVSRSLALVDDFAMICADDPMINFDVPGNLGVGIARGAATRLVSGRTTLDYSGRPLNVASRMNDLARPSGVVFPASLGPGLLSPNQRVRFVPDHRVFLRGVADDTPTTVYVTHDRTTVPASNRRPFNKRRFHEQLVRDGRVEDLEDHTRFQYQLAEEPLDPDAIMLAVHYPDVTRGGRPHPSILTTERASTEYVDTGDNGVVEVDLHGAYRRILADGVKPTWNARVVLEYWIADDG